MIIPTCEETLKPTPKYGIVPTRREIYAGVITPITLLRRIARQSKRFFLLESIEGGEGWGCYSFLGHDPAMRAACKSGFVIIESSLREIPSQTLASNQPLQVIREVLSRFKSPSLGDQPPFIGGLVGYFAYAMVEYIKPVLRISRGSVSDSDLMLFDKVIAYDHLKQKIGIVVDMKTGRTADLDPCPRETQYLEYLMKEYGRICGEIETITPLTNQSSPLKKTISPDKPIFTCSVSRETFCRTVEEIKEYTLDGDIFQTTIFRQSTSSYEGSLLGTYRTLRTTNPLPYMVYMNASDDEIISTSPETSIRLKDGHLITFPVVGSRPRGATPEEDRQLEKELLEDERKLSEHNMLVSLGRNGIGKITAFDSVEVTEYRMIHRYPEIMHICSQAEGDTRSGLDGCSTTEALPPADALLGAPKIRACQVIEEPEQVPKRIYGGTLGYPDFTGSLDTCITTRTAVKQGGRVTVQTGGGVVMDSVSKNEHEEPTNKARAAINATINAGEVNDK